nr:MbcA/ParS/Xre antitoxin family protein [Pseudomonas sp. ANT_J12]
MAEVLFGDETKARRWLSKSKERLAGRKPYEMLSTTPAHGRSS